MSSDQEKAYLSITRGVRMLDLCGTSVPSKLVLTGHQAFPLAMNSSGQVLMAASAYGRGRIVVLGHESYLEAFPGLVENALRWLRGDGSDNLSVGVHHKSKAVAHNLSSSSFRPTVVERFSEALGAEVGVYVTDGYCVAPDGGALVHFMKMGGGLLVAGQAWHWRQQHPEDNILLTYPGNQVTSVAGIYFSEQHVKGECLPVYPHIPSSWRAVAPGKDFAEDLGFLLRGVEHLDIQGDGVPSELLVHGPLAFPIGTTQDGRAFLAGGYHGQGRFVVISHESYLGREELAPFLHNALQWLDEGRRGLVGVHPAMDFARPLLSQSGLQCEKTAFHKELSVFVCNTYSDEHKEEIQNFVAEGGGLLIGGHAWHWAYTHPEQNPLTDYEGNRVLTKMGVSVLGDTLAAGRYEVPQPSQASGKHSYHFRQLLRRFACHMNQGEELTKQEEAGLKHLGGDCAHYLQMKAYDCSSYTQVLSTLTDILKKSGMPQACEDSPVRTPRDHLLLTMGTELYKVCEDPDVLLPYLIKDHPGLPVVSNHKVQLDVNTEGEEQWVSTGLYLSPGMKTYIVLPSQIVNKGWQVQIGCQTDRLNKDELKRAPLVHERFPVTTAMMQVWNLWGGLIYLLAPPNTQVEGAELFVEEAVLAPYYKSGVTTLADWSSLRAAPAPWAELEFDNIVLTVPSDTVRQLERPDELAALWDDIMRGVADLAAIPHRFPRKERFVADVQISAGWMHAGYPIMMHTVSAVEVVNEVATMRRKGLWGPIHELGHNQQRACWEIRPHTTEGTCNLWSVYVHEEVLGISREKAHPDMTREKRKERVESYIKGGRSLDDWHVWVALETYLQLQEQFGWESLKKVFSHYHTMEEDIPQDNHGKMNLYVRTFSRAVERNLCGFFKAWGWPVEAATEQELSGLPAWSDHPMV